jgi:hypothetical protein
MTWKGRSDEEDKNCTQDFDAKTFRNDFNHKFNSPITYNFVHHKLLTFVACVKHVHGSEGQMLKF